MPLVANPLVHTIIGCAIEVHRRLGPGLLESTYESCFALELSAKRLQHDRQLGVPVVYKGTSVDGLLRVDFFVEGAVLVELKSIEQLLPVHKAQLITYVRLLDATQGLLINFNVTKLVDGIVSVLGRPRPDVMKT